MAPARAVLVCLLLLLAGPVQAVTLVPGDLIVLDQVRKTLFRVDPDTGDRTVVSGCANASCSSTVGSGTALSSPTGLARDPSGGLHASLYVTDTISDSLLRIDPLTGQRTVVSSASTGSGVGFISPFSVTFDASGNLLVADEGLGALVRVDVVSGNRTVVSGCTHASCGSPVGSGTAFSTPHDLVLDASGDAFVLDPALDAVFSVDLVSGDRTLVSSGSQGTGPTFVNPRNLTLDATGQLLVSDSNTTQNTAGIVFRVDPVTGNRTVVASGSVGSGSNLQVPVGLLVDDADQIIVLDFAPGVVFAVDPSTGDRLVLSSQGLGSGFTLDGPVALVQVPIPEPGTLLLLTLGCAVLARGRRRG